MNNQEGGDQEGKPRDNSKTGWIARRVDNLKRHHEERRTHKQHESPIDRAARSTAWATWVIAFLTLVTVGVAVSTYCILEGQLTEMRLTREGADKSTTHQLAIMRDQTKVMQGQLKLMETDQRPWIGAPRIVPLGKANETAARFNLFFKNVGRTPTSGLYIGATTVDEPIWQDEVKRQCKKGMNSAVDEPSMFLESSVVPGEEIPIGDIPGYISTGFDYADLASRHITHPTIAGCVIYRSNFDKLLHQTGFIGLLTVREKSVSIARVVAINPD